MKSISEPLARQQAMPLRIQKMSLAFENALMPSENQQVLRLRLSNSINENKNNSKNCWISSLVIGVTANKHVDFFC